MAVGLKLGLGLGFRDGLNVVGIEEGIDDGQKVGLHVGGSVG